MANKIINKIIKAKVKVKTQTLRKAVEVLDIAQTHHTNVVVTISSMEPELGSVKPL